MVKVTKYKNIIDLKKSKKTNLSKKKQKAVSISQIKTLNDFNIKIYHEESILQ